MSYERSLSIRGDIGEEVGKQARKLMINIDRRLVRETPRDTGSAKASWIASTGSPSNAVNDIENPGGAENLAISQGVAAISKAKDFDTIYISNNQPYIVRLDQGWSQQQPNPFIDAIIAEEVAKS
jgi:hypothetical protein